MIWDQDQVDSFIKSSNWTNFDEKFWCLNTSIGISVQSTVYGIFQAGGCVDTAEHHFWLTFDEGVTNLKSIKRTTGASLSNGPFVFQPGHLILTNSFSKEVINPADISTPKIWDQSDNWFKSYGHKVFVD